MELATANVKATPIAVDHDARNLAIIYGSLGTLIAFASLIFAFLSWLRSRRSKHAAPHHASDGVELESNTPRDTTRTRLETQGPADVSHSYATPKKCRYSSKAHIA